MTTSLVSVVLPSFNAEATISRSIDAILAQQYKNIELLIVDDGSLDQTKVIVKGLALRDSRIRFISSKKNRGVTRARNIAIRLAKGQYIAFCDADDWWVPEKLALQVSLLQEKKATFSYTSGYYVEAESNWISRAAKLPRDISYRRLLFGNPIGLSAAIFDQSILGKVYFDKLPTPYVHEDYVYWLKLFKQPNLIPVYCSLPSMYVTIHKHTRSGNKWLAMRSQFYILNRIEGLSIAKSVLFVFTYLLFALHKRGIAVWYRHAFSTYR
ncbi:MAG: hypothetical protein RIT05_817 [Bacteroidota bacterium]|jgi:GT2 family glycosyltransferase